MSNRPCVALMEFAIGKVGYLRDCEHEPVCPGRGGQSWCGGEFSPLGLMSRMPREIAEEHGPWMGTLPTISPCFALQWAVETTFKEGCVCVHERAPARVRARLVAPC